MGQMAMSARLRVLGLTLLLAGACQGSGRPVPAGGGPSADGEGGPDADGVGGPSTDGGGTTPGGIEVLASVPYYSSCDPSDLVLSDDHVFAVGDENETIFAVPKSGGPKVKVGNGGDQGRITRLAIDSGYLYWAYEGTPGQGHDLHRVPVHDAREATVETRSFDMIRDDSLVAISGGVSWVGTITTSFDVQVPYGLYQLTSFDAAPQLLRQSAVGEGFGPLLADAEAFYFGDASGWVRVERTAPDGPVTVLAPATGSPAGLAVLDDQRVYWIDQAMVPDQALRTVPKLGGEVVVLASHLGMQPWQLAADDTHLYVAGPVPGGSDRGQVARVPKAGGAVEVLVDESPWPSAVAVDATHVYWTTASDGGSNTGQLKRMPKP
jgi:hypothetical protein